MKPKINILSGYTFFFLPQVLRVELQSGHCRTSYHISQGNLLVYYTNITSICNPFGYDGLTSMPFPLEAGFVTYQESEAVFGSFRGLKDDFEGIA